MDLRDFIKEFYIRHEDAQYTGCTFVMNAENPHWNSLHLIQPVFSDHLQIATQCEGRSSFKTGFTVDLSSRVKYNECIVRPSVFVYALLSYF